MRILSCASLSVRAWSLAKRNPIAVPALAAAACLQHLSTLQAGSLTSATNTLVLSFLPTEKFNSENNHDGQTVLRTNNGTHQAHGFLARNCSGPRQRASAPSVEVHRRLPGRAAALRSIKRTKRRVSRSKRPVKRTKRLEACTAAQCTPRYCRSR